MRRRVDGGGGAVESAKHALVLLGSDERANRQGAVEFLTIRHRNLLHYLESRRPHRAQHVHLERLPIVWIAEVVRPAAKAPGQRLERFIFTKEFLPLLR